MNDKFFDLKKEKQDRFICAALKVFAENGYKKASTDEIVKEAGISKGLLFHYFGSKQGLYEFVYDYSVKYVMMEYSRYRKEGDISFFELQMSIIEAQSSIIRTYPYMNIFLTQAFREKDEEVVSKVADSMDAYSDYLAKVYASANIHFFKKGVEPSMVLKMCLFIADGVMLEQFRNEKIDADRYRDENEAYLHLMREQFMDY